ncbi:hypothetical protein PSEUBRA_001654 [Kalmanozyma brasiliensis GHG001]|nr:uncharacterized protein PSEUBRA_001654 [Kalmanozyma brasiliensis GHG001]EST08584.2 hypothetical protein PSEUBRA_001654 [Kalmanozyma brasiliensis GHG001]
MSAAADESRSASPKRKPQQQPQRIGPIGVLSSPKFSFRAALVQHKASKLASKIIPASSGSPASSADVAVSQLPLHSQTISAGRPTRSINTSSIPSLSGRGRFNSASTDSSFTSTLPRRKDADISPATTRASSSLGKRPMDEATTVNLAGDSSLMSDFGPVMRKSSAVAGSSSVSKSGTAASTRSHAKTSRLPGPPSTRAHWSVAPATSKALPSPTTNKAPHKVARPDGVAEVHAASTKAPITNTVSPASARTELAGVRNRTISAPGRPTTQSQPLNKQKIGTLPKLKPKAAPIKTLLDERPIHRPRPSVFGAIAGNMEDGLDSDNEEEEGNEDDDDSDDDEDEDDEDVLEGPDVSRIRTKRAAIRRLEDTAAMQKHPATPTGMHPPASVTSSGSRIPSIGKATAPRPSSRPQRRSSSNSVAAQTSANEKENASQIPATAHRSSGSQRPSISASFGVPGRTRSSLPLAVSQPAPQAKAPDASGDRTANNHDEKDPKAEAVETATSIPTSPSKFSSLSALRSRGLQTDSAKALKPDVSMDSALPTRSGRPDLGIKSSIIRANPAHPSIMALQAAKTTQHQPISTPEALIKAKERISGVLMSSSLSSSSLSAVGSTASPSERGSSLARSSSVQRGLQKGVKGTQRSSAADLEAANTVTPSTSTLLLPRSASRSPIKSSLLLFPTTVRQETSPTDASKAAASPTRRNLVPTGTEHATVVQSNNVLSSNEIDVNLLASLRVVAQKANLKVGDLLDEERRQLPRQTDATTVESSLNSPQGDGLKPHARARREASQELEAIAGDVSVDLMAFDLAAGSPVSDVSVLRSPMARGRSYLDTPPSVFAALAAPKAVATESQPNNDSAERGADDEAHDKTHVDEDATDTSCASPSLRAAAALRIPRRPAVASNDNAKDVSETPVRHRGYRNVPSIPSTPFPVAGSGPSLSPSKSARAYPPSAAMSAKTRSRLKKALRESLNLEAHFASIRLGSNSNDDVLAEKLTADRSGRDEPKQKDEELLRAGSAKVDSNDMRKSISAMLLTEDDRYLDELVSAVARIGLEDLAPESSPSDGPADVEAEPASSAHPLEPAGAPSKSSAANSAVQAELSAALLELDTLRTQLQLSQTHTSSLEAQIAQHTASTARTARTQAILEADLAALKGEMAGVEWDKAKTDWARVRVEVLAELEDAKVQKDAMLVLGSQMGMWERMIRART